MGYSTKKYDQKGERHWNVHPIWRGIGCFFIILMPILAWASAELFMSTNRWLTLPTVLYQPIAIKLTNWEPVNILISALDRILSSLNLTYGTILFGLIFLIVGYGLLTVGYGIVYRLVGPPRYSKIDARPILVHKRRR